MDVVLSKKQYFVVDDHKSQLTCFSHLKEKKQDLRSAFWNCILMFFLISNSTGLSVKVMCKNVHAKYFIVRNKLSVYMYMCKNNSFPLSLFLHAKSLCCVLVVLQPKVSGLSDIIVSISLSVLSCLFCLSCQSVFLRLF